MNQVNRAAEHVSDTKPYLELVATPADADAQNPAAGGSEYPLSTTNCHADHRFFQARADWQVREDRSFYVPDLLSDKDYDTDPQAYAVAGDYAVHLRKAERLVCQAEDLVGLIRAAISDESDARAMQVDTALAVIEKKLCKAHSRINKHDRRHSNLFLAYFDAKNEAEGRKQR